MHTVHIVQASFDTFEKCHFGMDVGVLDVVAATVNRSVVIASFERLLKSTINSTHQFIRSRTLHHKWCF